MNDNNTVGEPTFDVDSLGFSDTIDETVSAETTNQEQTEKVEETQEKEQEQEQKQETRQSEEVKETPVEQSKEVSISNPPRRHGNETDIQYSLRTQIWNAGQAKAQAETEEEKSLLAKHILGLRKELAKSSSQQTKVEATQSQETTKTESETTNEVSDEEQIKAAIKKMGFLTAEEAEARALDIVNKTTRGQEHSSAIQQFYQSRKDIATNPVQREMLEKLVIEKFNITESSSGNDVLVAMDMAASYLFPKTDNRASNAQAASEKRDLVNFSSTTKGDIQGIDKNDKKTRDTLKDIGWTDEDLKSFGF